MRGLALVVLLLAAGLAGCAQTSDSGIWGVAMMGPTCPVERNPPDPNCADRPYNGTLVALDRNEAVAATFHTRADGSFNVSLAPGTYTLQSPGDPMLPRCAGDGPVTVVAHQWTPASVDCDTGIR